MSDAPYTMRVEVRSNWLVGYSPKHDEMFLYFIDQDDLCWVFRKGGLDVIGFYEFMNLDAAELLGDL